MAYTIHRNKHTMNIGITVQMPNNNTVDSSYIVDYYISMLSPTENIGYVVPVFTNSCFSVLQLIKIGNKVVFGRNLSIVKNSTTIYTVHLTQMLDILLCR